MIRKVFLTLFVIILLFSKLTAQEKNVSDSLKKHVDILASDSLSGRKFDSPDKQIAVDYIVREFKYVGLSQFGDGFIKRFDYPSMHCTVIGQNIVGLIEGSDPILKNEYILLGAHYDHLGYKKEGDKKIVYNGADDNASGVATIIEVGRKLISERNELKRSVLIVAFDGEEAGLLGSHYFVSDKVIDPEKIKVMFSVDMDGMYEKNKGVQFNGLNSFKNGKDFAFEVTKGMDININKVENDIERRTDTWSFALNNIPSIYVSTGLLSPYHKPEDDSNLLDYNGMAKIVNALSVLALQLSKKDIIETNQKFMTHAMDPKFQIGYFVNLGNSHFNYHDSSFVGKKIFAFGAGVISEFKLSELFSIRPAVAFESNGGKNREGALSIYSLSGNLDLLLAFPGDKSSTASVYLFAGGYYRYNFDGKIKLKSYKNFNLFNQDENGLRLGFGLETMKYQVNFYGNIGLTKINKYGPSKVFENGGVLSIVKFF